jgi:hypothetical protein
VYNLKPPLLDPAFGSLIIIGVALLLTVAGIHKLRSLGTFAEIFAAYRVLPESAARRLAWLIPCIELSVAAALLWEPGRPWAIVAAMGLLIAYASGLCLNLVRGRRDLDCGCGTAGDRRSIAAWMVWRNLWLVLALGVAAAPTIARPWNGFDLLTLIGGLTAGATLYVAVDRLLGDVAPRAKRFDRRAS